MLLPVPIIVLFLSTLVISGCGPKSSIASKRGAFICDTAECGRGDFSILDMEKTFEAGTPQTIAWEPLEGAIGYKLVIAEKDDCNSPVESFAELTVTEKSIVLKSAGSYYICLFATDDNGVNLEAKNSRIAVTVTDSTRAVLNLGKSATIDFGERVVGSHPYALARVANQGGIDATDVTVAGLDEPMRYRGEEDEPGEFPGSKGDCETTIPAGESCVIFFGFAPKAEGEYSVPLTLTYFDGVETAEVAITTTGTAVKAAALEFSEAGDFDFGDVTVGDISDKTFTFTNSGDSDARSITPATLDAPYSYKGGTFPGDGGTCETTVAPGEACTFVVSFEPSATGKVQLILTVNYSDSAVSQSISKNIQGTGK